MRKQDIAFISNIMREPSNSLVGRASSWESNSPGLKPGCLQVAWHKARVLSSPCGRVFYHQVFAWNAWSGNLFTVDTIMIIFSAKNMNDGVNFFVCKNRSAISSPINYQTDMTVYLCINLVKHNYFRCFFFLLNVPSQHRFMDSALPTYFDEFQIPSPLWVVLYPISNIFFLLTVFC